MWLRIEQAEVTEQHVPQDQAERSSRAPVVHVQVTPADRARADPEDLSNCPAEVHQPQSGSDRGESERPLPGVARRRRGRGTNANRAAAVLIVVTPLGAQGGDVLAPMRKEAKNSLMYTAVSPSNTMPPGHAPAAKNTTTPVPR